MMNFDFKKIFELWKKGYRTKAIVCAVAVAFNRFAIEHEYPDEEFTIEKCFYIAYGDGVFDYESCFGMINRKTNIAQCALYMFDSDYESEDMEEAKSLWDSIPIIRQGSVLKRRDDGSGIKGLVSQKHYIKRYYTDPNYKVDIYSFEYDSYDGSWCSRERPSRCTVVIDGTNVSLYKTRGVDPTVNQVCSMIFESVSRSAVLHKYNRCNRRWPYRIGKRIGYSGCEDYYMDLYYKPEHSLHYIKKCTASRLHVSMAGKISEISNEYVGDVIELLIAAAMGSRDDFCYTKSKKDLKFNNVRFVKPRKNEVLDEDELDFIPPEREEF